MAVTTQGDRITATDLQHSEDARSGLATALFSQNPSDTTNVSVAITFADGVTPPPSGFRASESVEVRIKPLYGAWYGSICASRTWRLEKEG